VLSWTFDAAGNLASKQEFKRPVVYLDHWAVRDFAADPVLAARFTSALKVAHGTWAVSLLNLMEFIQLTDQGQAAQFEELLEQALPDLFFIDFQAFGVMERERELAMRQGRPRPAPYGDPELLGVFADIRPDTPRPFTAKALATVIVKHRNRLASGLERFQNTIVERIELMRGQMKADAELEQRVKGSHQAAKAQRTWLFVRELLGSLLLDRDKNLTRNDAMDLFHAIVPVAYCDFVLLDGQWEHRVRVTRDRLVAHKIGLTPAEVFSKRHGGLEHFLQRLEVAGAQSSALPPAVPIA